MQRHQLKPHRLTQRKKIHTASVRKISFYGRAVDNTVLTPRSAIAWQQANPTTDAMAKTKQLFDYLASQDKAILTYSASDMVLAVHSDAGYLNKLEAQSRAGGQFFLSSSAKIPTNNGAILNVAQMIKNVMSSAAEAKIGALYIMAWEAVYIRHILKEMGHKQLATPIQTDNSTAEGVINSKFQPKKNKAMDMWFYWLRNCETQEQFQFFWGAGKLNLADYWTKHHPAMHHKNVRTDFFTQKKVSDELRLRLMKGDSELCCMLNCT